MFRSVFNDFGTRFTIVDTNGEQPLNGMIAAIDQVRALCFLDAVDNLHFCPGGESYYNLSG